MSTDPHLWPVEALERVARAVKNLTASEVEVGESSIGELFVAPGSLPECSDEPFGGAR